MLFEHSEQYDKRLLAPEVSMWHNMCCTDAGLNWPELASVWLKWVRMSAFGLDCSRKVDNGKKLTYVCSAVAQVGGHALCCKETL
jgi:hypothetical protein